jgi:hypothetical protein
MINPFLKQLSLSIEQTLMSQSLQGMEWVVAIVQTIHILAICTLMTAMMMSNFKVLGILNRNHVLYPLASALKGPAHIAILVLFLTGLIMIIGEPARALLNPIFQLKMLLLIAAIFCSIYSAIAQKKLANDYFGNTKTQLTQKLIAVISIGLWLSILFAGRWIAYT